MEEKFLHEFVFGIGEYSEIYQIFYQFHLVITVASSKYPQYEIIFEFITIILHKLYGLNLEFNQKIHLPQHMLDNLPFPLQLIDLPKHYDSIIDITIQNLSKIKYKLQRTFLLPNDIRWKFLKECTIDILISPSFNNIPDQSWFILTIHFQQANLKHSLFHSSIIPCNHIIGQCLKMNERDGQFTQICQYITLPHSLLIQSLDGLFLLGQKSLLQLSEIFPYPLRPIISKYLINQCLRTQLLSIFLHDRTYHFRMDQKIIQHRKSHISLPCESLVIIGSTASPKVG